MQRVPPASFRLVALALLSICRGLEASPLIITEIHYNPAGAGTNSQEWFEIYNRAPDPLDLSGYIVSRGVNFVFPQGTWLLGGQYLVVASDQAYVRSTYGITNTTGNWSPETALANSGETLAISDPAGVEMTRVRYNDRGKWPSGADGTGHTLSMKNLHGEQDDPDNWELSRDRGGSPGRVNPARTVIPVLINEGHLLPASGERWIELYNRGSSPIDLSGFQISNQRAFQASKYTLPAGTSIAAGGFLVFTEPQLGLDLAPDGPPPGGRRFVALVHSSGNWVVDARILEPDQPGSSEARIPDGAAEWSEVAVPTFGAPNQVDVERNVVINEIMYHPIKEDPRREYVELYNRGAAAVDMTGWAFTEGIRFAFPPGFTLGPGEYAVIARDPAWLRTTYGLPAGQVLGPAQDEASLAHFGRLSNKGERLTLSDQNGNIANSVRYHDGGDWPVWADGGGSSLELIDARQDNSRAQAWDASDDSAKATVQTFTYTGNHAGGEPELHFLLLGRGITLVDDIVLRSTGANLIQNGTFESNAAGWIIEGNHIRSGRTTENPIAGSGSLKLVATGRGDNKVNRVETATSNLSTSVTYTVSFRARWVVGAQTLVTRGYIQNEREGLARSHALQVPGDLGTPGRMNSVTLRQIARGGSANQEPVISGVRQDPAVPGGNESVVVRARVSDADGVAAVTLHYMLNTPGSSGTPIEPQPVGIFDDHRDVGNPCGAGSTTHLGGSSYRVVGGGDDIWTAGDQFHFAYIEASGDFDMRARLAVKDWAPGSRWGKGGIMARQDLSSTSRYVMIQDHGADLQDHARLASRPTHGGNDNVEEGTADGVAHPPWVRLARTGNTFRGYSSTDGVNWTQVGPAKNWGSGAPQVVLLGPALTSHAGCPTAAITFSDVTITGGDAPIDPGPGPGKTCEGGICTVPMTDPDGDGVYTATIPGQALGQKIVYFITATDAGGRKGRYPADVTLQTAPLLLDPAAAAPADHGYLVYRHDTRNPSTNYLSYRFWMHDANEEYLATRRLHSNDLVDGSFVFGGDDIYYNARLRFAGSPWARGGFGGSYRVSMPKDRPLHGAIDKFNMENHSVDSREQISHYLIRYNNTGTEKVPYSLQWMTRFQVNSRFSGNREHIQAPDNDFLSMWWPDDDEGSFFEVDDRHEFTDGGGRATSVDAYLRHPPYSSQGSGDNKEAYRWFFGLRHREAEDDYSHLIDLARLFDPARTSNTLFDQQVWQAINVESFLRVWAVRMHISDWDTWGLDRGKNCYLYRPALEGRWYLIPWDLELTYDNPDRFPLPSTPTGSINFKFPEVNRMLNRPRIKRMYYGILKSMVESHFRSTFLNAYMTRLDAIGRSQTGVGKSGGYIDQRRSRILNWISSVTSPTQAFTITTNGGNPITTAASTVTLAGNAPVEAFFILALRNGDEIPGAPEVEFSTSSITGWTLRDLPLVPGSNRFDLLAVSDQGSLVAATSITVTSTAGWPPPALEAVTPPSAMPGELVRLTGGGFQTGIRVFFGATQSPRVVLSAGTPGLLDAEVPSMTAGALELKVRNLDNQESNALAFTVAAPPPQFIRGDANLDGAVDVSDPIRTLLYLFAGAPASCLDALDANDDGAINTTDVILVLVHVFQGGPPPAAPYPQKGVDPTPDDGLGCDAGL